MGSYIGRYIQNQADRVILNHPLNQTSVSSEIFMNNVDSLKATSLLNRAFLKLVGQYIEDGTGRVDYRGIQASDAFAELSLISQQSLPQIDLGALSEHERLAFLLNLYNALNIHGLIVRGQPTTMISRAQFFAGTCYQIGPLTYSLDEVEHGLIRNAPHPTTGQTYFHEAGDQRRQYAVVQVDPRVHFALNCGARSCPRVRVYRPETLDDDLERATRGFIASETLFDEAARCVTTSRLFEWYQVDFGGSQTSVLQFIASKSDEAQRLSIERVLQEPNGCSLAYSEYDWMSNGVE